MLEHSCTHKQEIESMRKELYGNGDSSKSICSRITRLESIVKIQLVLSSSTLVAIVGAIIRAVV